MCFSVSGDGVGSLQDLLGPFAGAGRVPGLGRSLHGRLRQRHGHRQLLQPIGRTRQPNQQREYTPVLFLRECRGFVCRITTNDVRRLQNKSNTLYVRIPSTEHVCEQICAEVIHPVVLL